MAERTGSLFSTPYCDQIQISQNGNQQMRWYIKRDEISNINLLTWVISIPNSSSFYWTAPHDRSSKGNEDPYQWGYIDDDQGWTAHLEEEIRRTDLILRCSIYTLSRRQFYSSLCWELPGYGSNCGLLYSAERYLRFHLQAQRRMATIPFNMLVEKHF